MMNLLKYLFRKNPVKGRWVFLVAALLLALVGLTGYPYGALFLYMIPALLCLVQYFFPTVFVWGLFFVIFAVGSIVYSFAIVSDIYRLIIGANPSILVDANDSLVFILFLVILLGITFALFRIRPRLRSARDESI